MTVAIALIGYGEVGSIFARAFLAQGARAVHAFDVRFAGKSGEAAMARARDAGVKTFASNTGAISGADVVISAVTAGAALSVAQAAAPHLSPAQFFVDLNSVSPTTKQEGYAAVTAGGARYVEAAVMSPVPPYGLKAPTLLGGPHADALKAALASFDMDLTVFSEEIGRASAVKMCRSVMIKGIEALAMECFVTARRHRVENEVLASLSNLIPHPDWPDYARYLMSRALVHGRRRAEEMREVARTVEDAGTDPLMSSATAKAQDRAADLGARLTGEQKGAKSLAALADAISALCDPPQ